MLQMLSSLTGFDYLVLFVLLGCIWLGYRVGILIIFFFVMSIFGGKWIAHQYAAQWGMNLNVLFSLSLVVLLLVGYIINRFLDAFLGVLNSIMGAFAGILVGLFFISLALLPLSKHVTGEHQKSVLSSLTMRYLAPELERRIPNVGKIDTSKIEQKFRLPTSADETIEKTFDFTLERSTAPEQKARPAVETPRKKR